MSHCEEAVARLAEEGLVMMGLSEDLDLPDLADEFRYDVVVVRSCLATEVKATWIYNTSHRTRRPRCNQRTRFPIRPIL